MAEKCEDKELGDYVYCDQHMAPHSTGWCTVPNKFKTALRAKNLTEAMAECRSCGYALCEEPDQDQD